MRFKQLLLPAISLFLFNQAIAQSHMKTGIWRGALKNSAGNELPFNFEVKENAGKQQLIVMNGAERIKVTNIRFKGDSVLIRMPLFNSEFKLKSEATGLTGKWIKHYADRDMVMDFTAQPGESWRFFKTAEKPAFNI